MAPRPEAIFALVSRARDELAPTLDVDSGRLGAAQTDKKKGGVVAPGIVGPFEEDVLPPELEEAYDEDEDLLEDEEELLEEAEEEEEELELPEEEEDEEDFW